MDRGKPSSKMYIPSDASGLFLLIDVSTGNIHDSEGLKPMQVTKRDTTLTQTGTSSPSGCTCDRSDLRKWRRGKRIRVRIAREGIESGE